MSFVRGRSFALLFIFSLLFGQTLPFVVHAQGVNVCEVADAECPDTVNTMETPQPCICPVAAGLFTITGVCAAPKKCQYTGVIPTGITGTGLAVGAGLAVGGFLLSSLLGGSSNSSQSSSDSAAAPVSATTPATPLPSSQLPASNSALGQALSGLQSGATLPPVLAQVLGSPSAGTPQNESVQSGETVSTQPSTSGTTQSTSGTVPASSNATLPSSSDTVTALQNALNGETAPAALPATDSTVIPYSSSDGTQSQSYVPSQAQTQAQTAFTGTPAKVPLLPIDIESGLWGDISISTTSATIFAGRNLVDARQAMQFYGMDVSPSGVIDAQSVCAKRPWSSQSSSSIIPASFFDRLCSIGGY